jgi:hypothetical protein
MRTQKGTILAGICSPSTFQVVSSNFRLRFSAACPARASGFKSPLPHQPQTSLGLARHRGFRRSAVGAGAPWLRAQIPASAPGSERPGISGVFWHFVTDFADGLLTRLTRTTISSAHQDLVEIPRWRQVMRFGCTKATSSRCSLHTPHPRPLSRQGTISVLSGI